LNQLKLNITKKTIFLRVPGKVLPPAIAVVVLEESSMSCRVPSLTSPASFQSFSFGTGIG